jgi:Putative Flp pilus-assembly TadE/G-like
MSSAISEVQPPRVRSVERHRNTRTWRARQRFAQQSERGYVMVTSAILMPLLLILVSAATDVTYFYSRTVELQRIADTAALAGVVNMPNLPNAQKVAQLVATQNGAKHDSEDITVKTEAITGTNRRLKVTVRDKNVQLFFGRLFKDHWDISRSSTAEYISNIPLGSVLNAIGTGDIVGNTTVGSVGEGHSANPQNFWLTVQGPCASKEQGDQFSTRYDGTYPNASVYNETEAARLRRLCDYNPTQASMATTELLSTSQIATITAQRTAAQSINSNFFNRVSLNNDYDPAGYNYIIDVPCEEVNGIIPPPPCIGGSPITQDLSLEVFDPTYGPDSLQWFQRGGIVEQRKPDSYGVRKLQTPPTCFSADPTPCVGPTVDVSETRPADVRVFTQFRAYAPDDSPVDYSDDLALPLEDLRNRTSGVDAKGRPETNAVALFKTCMNATDHWMTRVGDELVQRDDADHDYVPDGASTSTTEQLRPIDALGPTGGDRDPYCNDNQLKWRTLLTLKAGEGKRGRYRINVRTVSSPHAFGSNAFALRARTGGTFVGCSSVAVNSCPSVSGDSSMSVFASVPGVSEFYLAQLAPASLFRGKTVVLQLWDIGEGGDTVEVLRPISAAGQCNTGVDVNPNYCIQKFNWNLWDPGINDPSGTKGLDRTGDAMADVCKSTGQENQVKLSVAGDWTTTLQTLGCTTQMDPAFLKSRAGYSSSIFKRTDPNGTASGLCENSGADQVRCKAGLFNDRLVALSIEVPMNYGCASGTGPDPTSGISTTPCVDAVPLPEAGWWKIRYTPLKEYPGAANYLRMTDATTWTVQLLGDPVHLVQNEK